MTPDEEDEDDEYKFKWFTLLRLPMQIVWGSLISSFKTVKDLNDVWARRLFFHAVNYIEENSWLF